MITLRIQYCLGPHGGLLSGLSVVHGGLHYLYEGYLNGLERRLTLCYMHFWSPGCFSTWTVDVCLCPCILWIVLQGPSVPSSRLFGPALSTKMILISTFMILFAPCWAFSQWMRCSTLTTYFTLTSGPGSSPRSLAFSCEGSDLVDCGRHCNSSDGLVSVKVLDGCFVLLCMLQ